MPTEGWRSLRKTPSELCVKNTKKNSLGSLKKISARLVQKGELKDLTEEDIEKSDVTKRISAKVGVLVTSAIVVKIATETTQKVAIKLAEKITFKVTAKVLTKLAEKLSAKALSALLPIPPYSGIAELLSAYIPAFSRWCSGLFCYLCPLSAGMLGI